MDPHMFHPKGPACCTQAPGQKTSAEAKSERSAKSARCSQFLIAPGWVSQTSTSAIFTGLDAFKFDSKASISVSRCRWLGDSMIHPRGRGRLHPWDANVTRNMPNMQRLQRLLTANWPKSVEIEIEYTKNTPENQHGKNDHPVLPPNSKGCRAHGSKLIRVQGPGVQSQQAKLRISGKSSSFIFQTRCLGSSRSMFNLAAAKTWIPRNAVPTRHFSKWQLRLHKSGPDGRTRWDDQISSVSPGDGRRISIFEWTSGERCNKLSPLGISVSICISFDKLWVRVARSGTTNFAQMYEILNVYPKLIQVHLHKHLREGEPLRHWIVVSDFLTLFGDLKSFSGSGLNIHANNWHAVCPLCWDYALLPDGRMKSP